MYSNIVKELVFQYIEHSILRCNFVSDITMYLFQVLSLHHWIYEFSIAVDYNVFRPSLLSDLTHYGASVIHLNGTSPSECWYPSCRHTKGHLWIEVCPYSLYLGSWWNTLPIHLADYFAILSFWVVFATLSIDNSHITRESPVQQVANTCIHRFLLYRVANHSRVALLHTCEWFPQN